MFNRSNNRREFTRVRTRIVAVVVASGFETIHEVVRDVSMKGVFLEGLHAPPVGSECRIKLILTGLDVPTMIETSGRVVRVTPDGFGVDFAGVEISSFDHLRRLVSCNAADAEEVEREFFDPNKSTRVH